MYLASDVSGQHIGPHSRAKQSRALTDTLSRNVGDQIPTYTAQHPRQAKASITRRRKPQISHLYDCFNLSVGHLFSGYVFFRIFHFPLLQQPEHIAQLTLIFVFRKILRVVEGSKQKSGLTDKTLRFNETVSDGQTAAPRKDIENVHRFRDLHL